MGGGNKGKDRRRGGGGKGKKEQAEGGGKGKGAPAEGGAKGKGSPEKTPPGQASTWQPSSPDAKAAPKAPPVSVSQGLAAEEEGRKEREAAELRAKEEAAEAERRKEREAAELRAKEEAAEAERRKEREAAELRAKEEAAEAERRKEREAAELRAKEEAAEAERRKERQAAELRAKEVLQPTPTSASVVSGAATSGDGSVPLADGKQAIAGTWYVKDVVTPITMTFDGREAKANLGRIDFVGTVRDGPNFEMDVRMGGFPIILEMIEKCGQKILQFSNGGVWSKDTPLRA